VTKNASIIFKKCTAESKQILSSILVSNREKALVYHRALHTYQASAAGAAARSAGQGGAGAGEEEGIGEGEDRLWNEWLKPVNEPFIMKIQSDVSKVIFCVLIALLSIM
jgi:hypothetical protein